MMNGTAVITATIRNSYMTNFKDSLALLNDIEELPRFSWSRKAYRESP